MKRYTPWFYGMMVNGFARIHIILRILQRWNIAEKAEVKQNYVKLYQKRNRKMKKDIEHLKQRVLIALSFT